MVALYVNVNLRGHSMKNQKYNQVPVFIIEPWHEISNNLVCATIKGSDQPAHTRSLIRAFTSRLNYSMSVRLLIEHHLEF